eukprot:c20789_g1_i1 orf=711-1874(-)
MENQGAGEAQWTAENNAERDNLADFLGDEGEKRRALSVRPRLGLRVGTRDLANSQVWQSSLVEFSGSIVMTFISIAAVMACLKSSFGIPRIAVAFTQFLIYTASILAAAPISGGHLNPSFTFATMFTGHISIVRSLLYIMAQSAGSTLGASIVKRIVSKDLSRQYFLGGCLLKQEIVDSNGGKTTVGVDLGKGLISEITFTFFLISVAYPVALEYSIPGKRRNMPVRGAIIIGSLLGLLIFVSGELLAPGYTSAGMNPARCFGPAIVQGGSALLHPQWVFWFGPLIASAVFALVYHVVNWHTYGDSQSDDSPAHSLISTALHHPPPPAPAPQAHKRMDVFLHIKAMMHKAGDDRERNSGPILVEEKDLEQAAASGVMKGLQIIESSH